MPTAVVPPIHDAGNTFVAALSHPSHESLFSLTEKRILLLLCATVFLLPVSVGLFFLKLHASPVALSADPSQLSMLPPGSLMNRNDELAMVEIFLEKANNTDSPSEKQQLYSQAQALVALIPQSSLNQQRLGELQQKIALATGGESGSIIPAVSPQRIAAPGIAATASLSAESGSNATPQSSVMPAGTSSLFVSYAKLAPDSQIYLTLPDNRGNAVIYVASRESGKGFTLASVGRLVQDVTVTWYEIK